MLKPVARLSAMREHDRELVWNAEENSSLAGATLGGEIIRVRFLSHSHVDNVRYQLANGEAGTLPYHSWMVAKGDEDWPLASPHELTQTILEPYLQGFAFSETEICLTRPLASQERLYGLGEHTGDLNKRGQIFPLWNIDPPLRHTTLTKNMYTSIPFYLGLQRETGRAYGVLVDHSGQIIMDMGHSKESEIRMTIEGDSMVVYFFVGPTPADVLRQYAELTGTMPLPARWTLGHHQCRWSYTSEEQVLELATRLRTGHHPCDAIWLDIDYMQGYRNFTWDPETFPNPIRMIQHLHTQGFRLVTIIDPGTKIDHTDAVYQQGMRNDYFCRFANGELFQGNVWPGGCVFPDFSRSEVRQWWGNLYQELLGQGVDAFWNDMNEPSLTNLFASPEQDTPALHGKTMDATVLHHAGGDQPKGPDGPPVLHKYFHNAYGMEMARSTYEGLARLHPNTRPFVLSRSGTAGIQRYAAVWTGDNTSTWEHIQLAITMCLDLSMSGVPFVGADIGGFWDDCEGELLARFVQLGALLPFSRNHNSTGNADQEPWAFGEPYESAYRQAIETRYRLMPYLYTLFYQASTQGAPIMRPLYYHYPQDEQACDRQDQFLVGDTLLSAPIFEQGATSRYVYLPAGNWFDYWNGNEYPGGVTSEISAPLERWPLLIRGNSILPSAPPMQYADERPTDPLTLTCYMASNGLANYTLYEDDGHSQAYKHGAFALTQVSCRIDQDRAIVRIDEQHDGYRPPRQEYEIVVWVGGSVLQRRVKAGQGSITIRL